MEIETRLVPISVLGLRGVIVIIAVVVAVAVAKDTLESLRIAVIVIVAVVVVVGVFGWGVKDNVLRLGRRIAVVDALF